MIARAKCAIHPLPWRDHAQTIDCKIAQIAGWRARRAARCHARNPNLNQQTRRVLGQHYRAKYGVK